MKKKILTLLFCLFLSTSYGQTMSRIQIDSIMHAFDDKFSSPIIQDNFILFYYKGKATSVSLAGDFTNWKVSAHFIEREKDEWIYIFDKPLEENTYHYRLLVDGFWTYDPFNKNNIEDKAEDVLSTFVIDRPFPRERNYSYLDENGCYHFKYIDYNAKNVSIIGTFNNWNPYLNTLVKTSEKDFELTLKLEPGLHFYAFMVDGEWIADPLNSNQFIDSVGSPINALYVPKK